MTRLNETAQATDSVIPVIDCDIHPFLPRLGGEVFRRAERLPVLTTGQRETLQWVQTETKKANELER